MFEIGVDTNSCSCCDSDMSNVCSSDPAEFCDGYGPAAAKPDSYIRPQTVDSYDPIRSYRGTGALQRPRRVGAGGTEAQCHAQIIQFPRQQQGSKATTRVVGQMGRSWRAIGLVFAAIGLAVILALPITAIGGAPHGGASGVHSPQTSRIGRP